MDLSFPDFFLHETIPNDNLNSTDLTQNYLLLKKKVCETHEVIKQYNDKLKECERLKSDLDAVTKQTKKVTCNYNSTLAKVIKLEIQNTEYKKNIDTLTTQVNDHKIKAAADQQYIQQLICKIKDVESQSSDIMMQCDLKKSSSEMKIKELEAELKTIKKTYETKIKKMEKKSPAENNDFNSSNNIITKDVATNTCNNNDSIITKTVVTNSSSNCNNVITKNMATNTCSNQKTNVGTITTFTKDEIMKKPQISDKCVLTDEFYSVKNDMYPIFCAKCEVHIEPTPFHKICKIMTESCPKLIEKISSPLKKPAPVLPDVTSGYRKDDDLIDLPETPPQNFYTEVARSAFASPNLPAPTPLDHVDYCHNFSQPPGLLSQSAFFSRSSPIRVPLANITTASQTDHYEGKMLGTPTQSVIFKLQDQMDTLEKKLRKKMKKLKSQKSSSCCQHSHPNSPYMFDMNSTMQFNFMELCRRMSDMYQPTEKEPVAMHKLRDKTPMKSKLSQLKPTKRLRSAYSGSSWEVESVSKKAEKSSVRKRPKKHKHKHSMLLKKSDVSIENSEHLQEPASNSDSNSYDNLFDAILTNEDVSNEPKDSSCEETMNETCNDVIKPLTHSSAHSTDMDEPETMDRVKNSVECSKSMGGETDSGILSDSVESSKVVQYEPDLDSCFVRKSRNTRGKATVRSMPSFAGNFKSNRSRSTEKSPTNKDKPNSVLPSFLQEESETPNASEEPETPNASEEPETPNASEEPETPNASEEPETQNTSEEPETPNASEEPEILESTSKNVTVRRKRKFGELDEPKHRLELMRKLRNLTKKPIKIPTFPKLHITKEAAYCEDQNEEEKKKQEEEKKQQEQEAEIVEEDYVPKKKARIAHISKVAKKANISLNSCAQAKASLVKNVKDEKVKPQTTTVDRTEPDTSITEETNMIQETPVQTVAKEDSKKLADKSNSETVEDISPLSSSLDLSDEMPGDDQNEQLKIIPVEPVFDISVLIEQSEQSRKGLEINSPARKKSVTEIGNAANNISALEQSEQRRKGLAINLPTNNRSVVDTDNTTNDISTLSEQSEQTTRGFGNKLSARKKSVTETDKTTNSSSASIQQYEQTRKEIEINLPTRIRSLETDNIENESNDELRIDGSNQLKEWAIANDRLNKCLISPSCQNNDNLCRVEEVVENNKPFDSKGAQTLREYRAKEMHYYRDIKLNSYAPFEILEQLNNENSFKNTHSEKQCKRSENIHAATDMFVTKQLQRLVDSEWESGVHQDVFEKLKTACTHRIIAKNIVDFLSTEEECKQILDKTYTPPAPLMTKSQQRITTLLVDLEKEFPMIIELVQRGIEYKIFKFNQKLYRYTVESLARMYTVLARVQKDRQRVRIFCCDALYCLGLNATIVLYTVFTSWPEVLPSNDITKDCLPKCIAHLILSMSASDYPKLSALKSLVRIYYKYPLGTLSKDMIIDLLKAFQEKCQGDVMAAITLLAKKEGTAWTYKNIIKGVLLPMIVNNKCHSEYKAFCLLGTLLRPFPIGDEDKAVGDIVEQLSDLCDSDAVSFEQQEGVMSALMSLSRHKFDVVLPHVLKWTPNLPLRDRTVDQIYGLYNIREPTYWSRYIRLHKKSKT